MALILPPIKPGTRLVNPDGTATRDYAIWWQRLTDAIGRHEATQDDLLEAIVFALAAAQTADEKAIDAAREAARINSYTVPTNVVSAADVGSSCTITVAAHIRVYPVQGDIDVPDVSLVGGKITLQPYSTELFIYSDDATLANVAPTFLATTSQAAAQVGAATGRHFVGRVVTPAAGAPPATGGGGYPPGGGGGNPLP